MATLTATAKMTFETLVHEMIQGVCTTTAVTVAEVLNPSTRVAVDVVYHRVGRLEALRGRGKLSDPIPETTLRLETGFEPKIRPARGKVRAFVAVRETEKIQSLFR